MKYSDDDEFQISLQLILLVQIRRSEYKYDTKYKNIITNMNLYLKYKHKYLMNYTEHYMYITVQCYYYYLIMILVGMV